MPLLLLKQETRSIYDSVINVELHNSGLCCPSQFYPMLPYTMLHYVATWPTQFCVKLLYTILSYFHQHNSALCYTVQFCTKLLYTILHYVALHNYLCPMLSYTILHYVSVHNLVLSRPFIIPLFPKCAVVITG